MESTFIPWPKGVQSDALDLFHTDESLDMTKQVEVPRGWGWLPNVKPTAEIPETHLLPEYEKKSIRNEEDFSKSIHQWI